MALMEITATAEEDADLRRSAFKPNSPASKAVVDQLLRIIEKEDMELLVPCIKAIGNLARTFRATETRIISPLVRLLDEREVEVSKEACVALKKFACTENYLHMDHSKAIISAGGAKHLVQLTYFGEQIVQRCALILLCYICLHVPDSEELAQAEVLIVLEWAFKHTSLIQDENVEKLLPEAKGKLELYQSRSSRDRILEEVEKCKKRLEACKKNPVGDRLRPDVRRLMSKLEALKKSFEELKRKLQGELGEEKGKLDIFHVQLGYLSRPTKVVGRGPGSQGGRVKRALEKVGSIRECSIFLGV
ncbi:uncharacterized protein Fot_24272 [Forsythia ovata]|uniref:Uncharacterized protein n=1 Tax=Forsythia ovata TaxID=205694 RepID=A0ABD1U5Q9_9LAMI